MTTSQEPHSPVEERLSIPGLSAPVEVKIDTWGIPHIVAQSLPDLFFAQGLNAARDRLWQIDLARKRGLGLLAAEFGPGYLEQDRAARLFLFRGDMAAEWPCYGDDAEAICTAFAAGINAYIDLVAKEPARLPPEFVTTGTRPAKWHAADVVRIRTHGWVRNALSEVVRANVMARTDAETDLLRANLEPRIMPHVAEGLALDSIPLEVLDVYKLSAAPVTFGAERMGAGLQDAERWRKVVPTGEVVAATTMQGSNNWVIDGKHTATGRPILASDPHRLHAVPALRYLVHLTAPGFDAIGTGEPILPGIMIGHNGHSAFGLTLFFGPDEEDIYVYETKPDDPGSYRYQGGWERMRVIEEQAAVKGFPGQTVRLKFTRHGPVIFEDPAEHRAYAVRTVVTEPGTAPYAASLISMRTRSFDAFRSAMRKWALPAVNQIYSDVTGDICWITAGYSPVRENWNGLLPVPGDGRYEWKGYLDPDQMPWVKNPPSGFFATANEMNVPDNWPTRPEAIGFEWWEPSRARRVKHVLSSSSAHDVVGSQALQTDVLSLPAQRLQHIFVGLHTEDADARRALTLLRDWDCRLLADSAPAALFELWWSSHLKPGFMARVVPEETVRGLLLTPGDVESILSAVETPTRQLGSVQARDALLLATLGAAWRDATQRMGDDSADWAWGRLHQGYFAHALSSLQSAEEAERSNVGPLPKGGGESTPMMAAYRPADMRVYLGASVRIVIDVGDWDNSACINAPGQSGDPRSSHYADLAPLWAKGEYVPMLYSHAAIERVTEKRLILSPG
jgi:penicillin amidase